MFLQETKVVQRSIANLYSMHMERSHLPVVKIIQGAGEGLLGKVRPC